jgi:uncharacterized lipoprotein YmbA
MKALKEERKIVNYSKMQLSVTLMLLAVLMSCSSGSTTDIRYYLIDPVDQLPLTGADNISVQILDLHIPQYLERYQIALRSGFNQLVFSDVNQWGESLQKNLLRTMTRNLSRLLDTADIATPIARSSTTARYLIQVYVEQFDQGSEGRVTLAARYQISSGSSHVVLATRSFEVSGQKVSNSHSDMVASMQQLFNELCVDMAERIIVLDESRDSREGSAR